MTAAPGPIQSGLDHYLRDHPVDRCVRVVVVGTARGALGAAVAQLRERWTTVAACADVAKEAPWWVLAAGQRTVALLDCRADATPTSSLVTAAATAHHALVVVGLEEGLTTAVRRQVHLVSLVGEARLTLVVGRADGGGFDQASVDRISADFTAFATKLGRDVAATVTVTMLADYLAAAEVPQQPVGQPLRLRVDPSTTALSTATPSGAFTGTLLAGRIGPGDLVRLVPGGCTSTVVTAELAADSRTVTGRLAEGLAVAAGQLMCAGGQPAEAADQFEAHVVWFADQPMLPGRPYVFRSAGGTVGCGTLAQPKYRVNLETLDQQPATKLELDEVGVCNLALDQPIAFDPHGSGLGTGQLTILDRQTDETVGVALIHFALRRAHNVHWQATTIDKAARQTLNGHGSAIVWFTGLSGSGKSAIANAVERRLHQLAVRSYLLDGDNVRHGLNRDLGFTAANRIENVRRVAEVAVLMADAGLVVLTALISPFSAERRMARERAAAGEFFEVFVDTPLAVAEQRDAKGLYAKARRGELTNFTGIDSPYEAPEHAEIVIDTMTMTVDEAAELVVAQLAAAGVISG